MSSSRITSKRKAPGSVVGKRHLRWRRRGEEGYALILVMTLAVVVLLVGVSVTQTALGSLSLARSDQDWNAALAVAEGGVQQYVLHLDQESTYWQQYSATNPDPTMTDSQGDNPFLSASSTKGWVALPGSTTSSGSYHWDVDTSQINATGIIILKSTGLVRNQTRTVSVVLHQDGYLNYLLLTNYSVEEPTQSGNCIPFPDPGNYYSYNGRNDNNCSTVMFYTGDKEYGPVHSNDAMYIGGTPQFYSTVTDSDPNAPYWIDEGSGNPQPAPTFSPQIPLPVTNSILMSDASNGDSSGKKGCLYTGPTRIVFNADGTMTVSSPDTKSTNPGCPTNGTGALPPNGVIYVQNEPASPTDPNYKASVVNSCNVGAPTLTPGSPGSPNVLGYPHAGDVTTYGCDTGDAYVSGTVNGKVTIGMQNDLWIMDDILYAGGSSNPGSNVLGLVPERDAWVYHPVTSCTTDVTNFCNMGGNGEPIVQEIDAAVFAVTGGYGLANPGDGAGFPTPLTFFGSLTENYFNAMGVVLTIVYVWTNPDGSQGSNTVTDITGYSDSDHYDSRLAYLTPPDFIQPVNGDWLIRSWAEIPAVSPPA